MKFNPIMAPVLTLLAVLPVMAAPTRHITGGVTTYQKGSSQMVVCSIAGTYTCNLVHIVSATKIVDAVTGKPAQISRGDYVDVEASTGAGAPVAVTVKDFSGRAVRSVHDLKPGQDHRVAAILKKIKGVRVAQVNPELQEVYLVFDSHTTTAAAIAGAAARKGVQLALPGS